MMLDADMLLGLAWKSFAIAGVTLLLAEQSLGFARRCTDYVYLLDSGRIVFQGSWQAFDEHPELESRYLAV